MAHLPYGRSIRRQYPAHSHPSPADASPLHHPCNPPRGSPLPASRFSPVFSEMHPNNKGTTLTMPPERIFEQGLPANYTPQPRPLFSSAPANDPLPWKAVVYLASERSRQVHQLANGHCSYFFGDGICFGTWIYHIQMVQLQGLKYSAHRSRQSGSVHPFAFKPVPAAILKQQQVQFRATVCGPKISFIRRNCIENLFNGITFPRSALFGFTCKS